MLVVSDAEAALADREPATAKRAEVTKIKAAARCRNAYLNSFAHSEYGSFKSDNSNVP